MCTSNQNWDTLRPENTNSTKYNLEFLTMVTETA